MNTFESLMSIYGILKTQLLCSSSYNWISIAVISSENTDSSFKLKSLFQVNFWKFNAKYEYPCLKLIFILLWKSTLV